ncbi:MAG TPA: HPF/RaiA family ribosome-associated protein [Syntrophorhabdales bacterium]|nr:HPF/RaiA family ribosome-associated protein [Syntrophorhabdales bacterium]
MKIPLQITFQDIPPSEAVEAKIREAAAKLDQFYAGIMSCRAVVSSPQKHQQKGKHYHVRLDVSVPGKELVVNREPGDRDAHFDIFVAIRDAFGVMERMLRDYSRQKQGMIKQDIAAPRGRVSKLFPEEGYGFIETMAGEIYFHRNSVLNNGFAKLKAGMEVRYTEEEGEKGPQASTVEIVG